MTRFLRYWPGYPGLVRYGRWAFLAVTLVFALALNLLLILNFFWTEYLTTPQRGVLLLAFLLLWGALYGIAAQLARRVDAVEHADTKSDGFREATLQYLRGNWFETQCCLNMLLRKNPRDVEALLMLATLFRHTRRPEDAWAVHKKLDMLEDAAAWQYEIAREKHLLNTAPKIMPEIEVADREPEA